MEKKIYTTPTLSVEEYEFIETTSTSGGTATSVSGNVFEGGIQSDANYSGGARANNRGIWDED
jgi:hypothetical protein